MYHEYNNYLKDENYDYSKLRDDLKNSIDDNGKNDIIKKTIKKCNKKNDECYIYSVDGRRYYNNSLYD